MNLRDKKLVYKACKLVDQDSFTYSCWALAGNKFFKQGYSDKPLVQLYGKFFKKNSYEAWTDENGDNPSKEQRLLMLLLFAECGGVV